MKFKFEVTGDEYNERIMHEFEAHQWYQALDRFVLFLRGCGYKLENNSVGINTAAGHYVHDDEYYQNIVLFEQGD